VTDISALSPHVLPALKSVDLRSCTNLKGIEALGGEAIGGSVQNKLATRSYQRGETLGSSGSAVGSLSALSLMRVHCKDEWLQYLPATITSLNLSGCEHLSDKSAIQLIRLPLLRELDAPEKVTDNWLDNLCFERSPLEVLDLEGCSKISSLAPLDRCTHLCELKGVGQSKGARKMNSEALKGSLKLGSTTYLRPSIPHD
jgi:hypothetical protein